MEKLLDLPYSGLYKVISGGQTGADQAGLFVAKHHGIATGGMTPAGWKTLAGPAPWLEDFGLTAHSSPDYPPRTKKNAECGDGTVRLATNFDSPGEICTLRYVKAAKKPYFDVLLDGNDYQARAEALVEFLINHHIGCLNVAGNADRNAQFGYHFTHASKVLTIAFAILQQNNLIIKL